jgi:hypothetical protein
MAFKKLTTGNWLEPDETSAIFARADWPSMLLAVELGSYVPEDIRDLFAVARGVMLYGLFFYPLYTAGDEQMHRVAEAAAKRRYLDLGGPRTKYGEAPSFFRCIEWLVRKGAIPVEEQRRWHAYRDIRNSASHPSFQQLEPPHEALRTTDLIARSVDALFRPPMLRPV